MPASATNTNTTKTTALTHASIEKACEKVKDSIVADFADTNFKDAAELVCRLFIKRIKEELK